MNAKFKVSRVSPWLNKDNEMYAAEVEMTPDYADGKNKEWSEATPSGVCRLSITNLAAVEKLPFGKEVTITFS